MEGLVNQGTRPSSKQEEIIVSVGHFVPLIGTMTCRISRKSMTVGATSVLTRVVTNTTESAESHMIDDNLENKANEQEAVGRIPPPRRIVSTLLRHSVLNERRLKQSV
jgi:hypothetical protein